jgi:outer membrane lipoprotein SlyB
VSVREIAMKPHIAIAALLPACLALAPTFAQQPKSGSSYTTNEANQMQSVVFGEILAVTAVEIKPGQTRVGVATGAILGGIGGSQIGSGRSANTAGAVAGAVAGGAVGGAIQGSKTTQGVELTVRLESGQTVAVVQPGIPEAFRVGDTVRIIGSAGNARVAQ